MQTKFIQILITCLIVTTVFSQANLNDYKYVIVSKKYDFLKEADQYQINSLSKFLFNKYGFQALMEGENYPQDLIQNRCLALKSDLLKDSGIFKTKLIIELTDCNDQVIYTSPEGESREKEYKQAYTEATRNAFKHLELLNYKYVPNENTVAESTPVSGANKEVTQEIQKLKGEIQTLKEEQKREVVEVKKPTAVSIVKKSEPKNQEVKQVVVAKKEIAEVSSDILYAQVTENGFQLVDNTPKVVCRISETGVKNVYLVENESAIIYKQNDEWIYEAITKGVIKQKKLNIKF
jgi:hypothetical protein